MQQMGKILSWGLVGILSLVAVPMSYAERLKDIASVQGIRSNQLIGYGLVVGLNGTGDKAPFTNQTFTNMMNQFGITLPPGVDPKSKNVAAVTVSAELPPFAKPGQTLDITVASIGNASSLRGGTLLMTPLRGADNNVYAVAQGHVISSGFGGGGADGTNVTVGVPSVARIPNGASVERTVPSGFHQGDTLTFNLHTPDFTTAKRVAERVNELLGDGVAQALDAVSVRVRAPRDPNQRVSFMSILENLDVEMAEVAAKVVINSRTGTIVIGKNVTVSPAAVTHGSLTVSITENYRPAGGAGFNNGETQVQGGLPQSDVAIQQQNGQMFKFAPGVTLDEIVRAVNQVGAPPTDLMAILEALKQAGALKADLIVI